MRAAAEALEEFDVPYEADVVSAHRMPHEMIEYGSSAERRGLRVIIAGAGGAAHLPGMLASVTPLPVIGVPVPLANLSGLDSLLSIVQMPAGIPVATVAVGGARNAGLLAVRILGAADSPQGAALRARLRLLRRGPRGPGPRQGRRPARPASVVFCRTSGVFCLDIRFAWIAEPRRGYGSPATLDKRDRSWGC